MTSVYPIPTDEQTRITVNGRSRLWLASWLARRPDVMARLVRTYHRLKRRSLAQRRRLATAAVPVRPAVGPEDGHRGGPCFILPGRRDGYTIAGPDTSRRLTKLYRVVAVP
jgi:hypothetical protein